METGGFIAMDGGRIILKDTERHNTCKEEASYDYM